LTREFVVLRRFEASSVIYRLALALLPHLRQEETVVADQSRRLCIVSRDRLDGRDFLSAVQAAVQPEDYLEVIVDRRRGEAPSQWRGANDRRKRPHVELELQARGIAVVPAAVPGGERRPEPSPRDPTGGRRFEDRMVGWDAPPDDRSLRAELDAVSPQASSRLAARVATTPDDYRPELYEGGLDDDVEQLEAIRSFKRERPPRRSLWPWIIVGLALVAAMIVLSPLAHSLRQTLKDSLEPLKPSAPPRASSETPGVSSETPPGAPSEAPRASPEPLRASSSEAPRATDPSAGGEPSPQAATEAPAGRRARPSVNEPGAGSGSAQVAPQTENGTAANRRGKPSVNEPAPRRAVAALPPPEPGGRLMTSPRFPNLPRVDVSRESGAPHGIYSARILDPAGRPLSDADVLLLARMSDGTVENVRLDFFPDRGIYRGALPSTRASIVYLRLRVITGDKRIEIPVEP
jgi:hypothetical protein